MTSTDAASSDKILGCLLGGAIGDAFGGRVERGDTSLSDDTQLTLATCESIVAVGHADPEHLARTCRDWFRARRFTGLGSATLKALGDLDAGGHWALSVAQGERAAGNGGAMRIAPLAFLPNVSRTTIRDVVRITHRSDEAYVGALAVVGAIHAEIGSSPAAFLNGVAADLPDSNVRDRLRTIGEFDIAQPAGMQLLERVSALGTSGYVVDTVGLALVGAWTMVNLSFAATLDELCRLGGDTDTIASIAGQIAGATLGLRGLPTEHLDRLPERQEVERIAEAFAAAIERGSA